MKVAVPNRAVLENVASPNRATPANVTPSNRASPGEGCPVEPGLAGEGSLLEPGVAQVRGAGGGVGRQRVKQAAQRFRGDGRTAVVHVGSG